MMRAFTTFTVANSMIVLGLIIGGCGNQSKTQQFEQELKSMNEKHEALSQENKRLAEQSEQLRQEMTKLNSNKEILIHENQRARRKLEAIFAIVRVIVYLMVTIIVLIGLKFHGKAMAFIESQRGGKKVLFCGFVAYVIYDVIVNSALIIDWLKGPLLQ